MAWHTVELNSAPKIKALILRAFPGYKRKSAAVISSDHVTLTGLNWSGGSRNEYRLVLGDRAEAVGDHIAAPWSNADEGRRIDLLPGQVAVAAGTCCGKPALAKLYIRPADIEPILGL